jgi:hypothetical protein
MAVPAVNIVIEKETDFSTKFKLKSDGAPINLTGYTFTAKMRKHYAATTSYEFDVEAVAPLSSGIISVGMGNTITGTIPPGRYYYDVLITSSGVSTVTTKVIEGTVLVRGTAS